MKTRTDTGMSRIRLASLALLAGLLLAIAWPLNISAQEKKGFINFERNQIENNSANPGANRGTTVIGGNGNVGTGLLFGKDKKVYNVPSYWLWHKCFPVLVHNANLSLLGLGTTQAEGSDSGKLPDNSGLLIAPTVFDRIRGMDSLTEGVPPDSNFIQQEVQVKSGGQGQEPGERPLLYEPVLGSDARATYEGRVVTPGSTQFFATDNFFLAYDTDSKRGIGTWFDRDTVGNNPEEAWRPVKVNRQDPTGGEHKAEEISVGVTKRLGSKGLFRADVIYREWEDFYSTRNDINGDGDPDPILNPDGSLVSNLHPIDIGIWIGQIEVALQNPKLNEAKRKKLEDTLKKLKAKKGKPTGPAPTGASLGSDGTSFIEERGRETLRGSLEYVEDTSWGLHTIPDEHGNAPGSVPFPLFTDHIEINESTVKVNAKGSTVYAKKGTTSFNSDGSPRSVVTKNGVKLYNTNNGDETTFSFLGPNNINVFDTIVKVLGGKAGEGNSWRFSGSGTDVDYNLTVADTVTGVVKEYVSPPSEALTDTEAYSSTINYTNLE